MSGEEIIENDGGGRNGNAWGERKKIAVELFAAKSAILGDRYDAKKLAERCMYDAIAFLDVFHDFKNGLISVEEPIQIFDEASAPNLKKTHPVNMISRAFGNLDSVKQFMSDLQRNPMMKSYERYDWGIGDVEQAKVIFPPVLARAEAAENAKMVAAKN